MTETETQQDVVTRVDYQTDYVTRAAVLPVVSTLTVTQVALNTLPVPTVRTGDFFKNFNNRDINLMK